MGGQVSAEADAEIEGCSVDELEPSFHAFFIVKSVTVCSCDWFFVGGATLIWGRIYM